MSLIKFKCPHCKQNAQTTSGGITLEAGVEIKVYCPLCGKRVKFTATCPDQKDGIWEGHVQKVID